jgi:putative NADH-flavin reductase
MPSIALFGGTGRTGRIVLTRALEEGLSVRALAHDPAKLAGMNPLLTVITGGVTDPDAVQRTITGADAVVSVFGHVKGSPPTIQADGTRVIVEAMKAVGVTRIVSLSGGGVPAPPDRPKPADKAITFLLRTFAGAVLADGIAHARVLEESELDWTIVRAPRLTDGPRRGTYRVGWVGVNASTRISRADLADFILTQVDDRQYLRQLPFVST